MVIIDFFFKTSTKNKTDLHFLYNLILLYGVLGYGDIVLHDAENCNKITALCDHGILAYDIIQYNHGALRLDAVRKGYIIIFYKFNLFCLEVSKKINFSQRDLFLLAWSPRTRSAKPRQHHEPINLVILKPGPPAQDPPGQRSQPWLGSAGSLWALATVCK
jgi:hypothetical protein